MSVCELHFLLERQIRLSIPGIQIDFACPTRFAHCLDFDLPESESATESLPHTGFLVLDNEPGLNNVETVLATDCLLPLAASLKKMVRILGGRDCGRQVILKVEAVFLTGKSIGVCSLLTSMHSFDP